MITISIYGIDPYLLRQISREMTPKLADIFECNKDDIDFYAPEGLFVHDGVEQNTRNILVRVNAPLKVKVMEKKAVEILRRFLKDACVHFSVEFYYYSEDDRYEFIDEKSPRFMTEDNSAYVEEGDIEASSDEEKPSDEEPYLGNAFEDFEKKHKGD
jgi:hypothetical protein